MARGKYKAKKARAQAPKPVVKAVEQVSKISDATAELASIQAKWNAADKKGRKKLQKQLDKARGKVKSQVAEAKKLAEQAEAIFDAHEEAIKKLEEEIRAIDWHGADPDDFWRNYDKPRQWAHDHIDWEPDVDDMELF